MSIVRPKYVQTLVRDPEYWSRPGHRARDAYIILKCISSSTVIIIIIININMLSTDHDWRQCMSSRTFVNWKDGICLDSMSNTQFALFLFFSSISFLSFVKCFKPFLTRNRKKRVWHHPLFYKWVILFSCRFNCPYLRSQLITNILCLSSSYRIFPVLLNLNNTLNIELLLLKFSW